MEKIIPFVVHCERINRRLAYYLRFPINDQLLLRIKELPEETRKWNPGMMVWEVTTPSLLSLIKKYRNSNKIYFDFGSEESRKIFISQIKKIEIAEEEKRKFIADLNIKKEEWVKYKKTLEETYEKYSADVHKFLKPGVVLYPHQIVASLFLNAVRNALLALGMGTGKSLISITYAEMNGFEKVFVITPNSLKYNYRNEIDKFSNASSFIIGKKNKCSIENAKYIITNYDYFNSSDFKKVKDKFDKLNIGKIDCLIVDECFTYDTIIKTNCGDLKIGDIVENNLNVKVLSYNHELKKIETKSILRYLYNGHKNVIRIKLSNGGIIECTEEHKFYSVDENKYKPIIDFKIGEKLYEYKKEKNYNSYRNMPSMWHRIQTKKEQSTTMLKELFGKIYCKRKCAKIVNNEGNKWEFISNGAEDMSTMRKRISNERKNTTEVLLNELCGKMENEPERNRRKNSFKKDLQKNFKFFKSRIREKSRIWKKDFRKNEIEQSHVQTGEYRKNERKARKIYFSFEGRKWTINKATIKTFFGNIWNNIYGNGVFNTNKKTISGIKNYCGITTNVLQGGYWNTLNKISNRSRRINPQNKEVEIFRQEKNGNIGIIWVENIEILESGNRQRFGIGGEQHKKTYDLEIEDNHNYFANNILVSNCHRISSTKTNTYKAFNRIFKDDIFRNGKISKVFMSGTPSKSRVYQLYSVLHQISPIDFPTKNYFNSYYCGMTYNTDGFGWETDISSTKFEELFNKIAPFTYRKKLEEVIKDLPEKTTQKIILEMTPKEYETYYKIEEGIVNEFSTKIITHPLAVLGKLREYTSHLKVNNVKELIDSILECGEKFVVVDFYKNSLHELNKAYPKESALHTGDESDTKRAEILKDFQDENGNTKLLLGSQSTISEGVTLTAANKIGIITVPWTPSDADQIIYRILRIGQKNAISAYFFVYKDSIDEYVFDLIESKRAELSQVIDGQSYESDIDQSVINDLIEIIKNKHKK